MNVARPARTKPTKKRKERKNHATVKTVVESQRELAEWVGETD